MKKGVGPGKPGGKKAGTGSKGKKQPAGKSKEKDKRKLGLKKRVRKK
jgi:hypothetical protein